VIELTKELEWGMVCHLSLFSLSNSGWPAVPIVMCPFAGKWRLHSSAAPRKAAFLLVSRLGRASAFATHVALASPARAWGHSLGLRMAHRSVKCGSSWLCWSEAGWAVLRGVDKRVGHASPSTLGPFPDAPNEVSCSGPRVIRCSCVQPSFCRGSPRFLCTGLAFRCGASALQVLRGPYPDLLSSCGVSSSGGRTLRCRRRTGGARCDELRGLCLLVGMFL
jgi:hypothetical protein